MQTLGAYRAIAIERSNLMLENTLFGKNLRAAMESAPRAILPTLICGDEVIGILPEELQRFYDLIKQHEKTHNELGREHRNCRPDVCEKTKELNLSSIRFKMLQTVFNEAICEQFNLRERIELNEGMRLEVKADYQLVLPQNGMMRIGSELPVFSFGRGGLSGLLKQMVREGGESGSGFGRNPFGDRPFGDDH